MTRTTRNAPPSAADADPGSGDIAPEDFVLGEFLPYRLSVTTNRISRAFAARYSERFGISIPEWRVLAVLGSFAPLSSNEICERTAMDKAKVSRAVAQLARKGLLDRAGHPADQRLLRLSLSAEGRRTYRAVIPIAQQLEAELTAGLTAEERAVLHRCLDRLGAAVGRLVAPQGPPRKPPRTAPRNLRGAAPFHGQGPNSKETTVNKQRNEGEGNKSADRNYREQTRAFIEKGEVEKKAKEAAREVSSPNQPLSAAEKAGRDRAAEEDPQVAGGGRKGR